MKIDITLSLIKEIIGKYTQPTSRLYKILPIDLIAALIFSCINDSHERTISSVRRGVMAMVGTSISRSAFWERLATKSLNKILHAIMGELMAKLKCDCGINSDLALQLGVTQILSLDSTLISLPPDAKTDFPGSRSNIPAQVKVHTLYNLTSGVLTWFKTTAGKASDLKNFPDLKLLKGCLIIFDLGYWDYSIFKELINNGIFFLTRVRSDAKIKITKVVSGVSKDAVQEFIDGERFETKNGKVVDLIGELCSGTKNSFTVRIVGFWNPTEKKYHWYVTNLTADAAAIYPLYKYRWQIELLFKTQKGSLHLDEISSSNKRIIESLILTRLIASLISTNLAKVALSDKGADVVLASSIQRAGKVFCHLASEIFNYVTKRFKGLDCIMTKLNVLTNELFDPNYKRRKSTMSQICEAL